MSESELFDLILRQANVVQRWWGLGLAAISAQRKFPGFYVLHVRGRHEAAHALWWRIRDRIEPGWQVDVELEVT